MILLRFEVMTNLANMIDKVNKSGPCLGSALDAFSQGDVESAIRCLNITFRHSTNTDWSDADTIKILVYLSRLYSYEGRFDKAATMLERAVEACKNAPDGEHRALSHLHYNLAECYLRAGQSERCKKNFLIALDLITKMLGRNSKSYGLVKQRYLMVCNFRSDHGLFGYPSGQSATEKRSNQGNTQFQFESVHSLTERKLDLVAF
jgi:tetratricopeptide (TPR) repeat protein